MILYNDKMLLLLNVNVSNYIICNIHLRPRYYKHKSQHIWIRILIFITVFFLHEWSFRSHETNESADRETASFWNCSPQWLFAVHHGNSLIYAFAEVSTVLIFCMQIFVLTKQQTGLFWIDVCAGLNLFGWCPSPQW